MSTKVDRQTKLTALAKGDGRYRPPHCDPAHLGSAFEAFLAEEGLLAEAQVLAVKKLLASTILEGWLEKELTAFAKAQSEHES